MRELTRAEKFIANANLERLERAALMANPNSIIERIDDVTTKINGFTIVCNNFNPN